MQIVDFESLGINTSKPGFYNDPNFIKIEKNNPPFLTEYNKYISQKIYSTEYLQKVKEKIEIVCEVLFSELAKDGRHGACIDISQSLSKILEKENIWCCTFSGSMTLKFPDNTNIPDAYFSTFDEGVYSAAHSWLFAPPFKVIDISIGLQKYNHGESNYLPKYVLEENVRDISVTPIDLINPKMLPLGVSMHSALDEVLRLNPIIKDFMDDFPPFEVQNKKSSISYFPIKANASDGEMDQLKCISFSGKSTLEVYLKIIKPMLGSIQST